MKGKIIQEILGEREKQDQKWENKITIRLNGARFSAKRLEK